MMILKGKLRPMGRVLARFCDGLGKFAVFGAARSRSYAKLFWLNNNRRLYFLTRRGYAGRGRVTMLDLPSSGLRPPSPSRWEKEIFFDV
jgi:hypothetical protein